MHDVYAYGVIAPSTLIELEGSFPAEAGYGEISGVYASLGGEAAGSAYVLSTLGVATKLTGTRMGHDPESQRVLDLLSTVGVDCTAVDTGANDPVTELVISSDGERTVFGTYGSMLSSHAWSPPSRADIESARIVCLDPFLGGESAQAALWCREGSTPYVTVDVPVESAIAAGAAVTIISEEFALRSFERYDPDRVISAYARACDGLVILTRGGRSVLFARGDTSLNEFSPYQVDIRDTTGAGDSFRAGIIYGLLNSRDDHALVETASAVAALVSQNVPGVLGCPSVTELERFLRAST